MADPPLSAAVRNPSCAAVRTGFRRCRRPADPQTMRDPAQRLREYAQLDRKRADQGLTPVELKRWIALKRALSAEFTPGVSAERADQRNSVRVPTRLAVSFRNEGELRRDLMTNLSRGGLFVETDQPCEIGTRLLLRIDLGEGDEMLEVPTEVVSLNVAPDLRTERHGMGLRFLTLDAEVQQRVDAFYERKLKEAARGAP